MMFGIILVGSILIFFDTSIPILIGGTVAFGILLIMGLGLLTIEDIKGISVSGTRSKDKTKNSRNKKGTSPTTGKKTPEGKGTMPFSGFLDRFRHDSGKEKSSTVKSPEQSKTADISRDRSGISAGFTLAIGSLKGRFIRSKDSSHGQKIDELLDSAIHEPVSSKKQVPVQVSEQTEEDDSIPDIFSDDFDGEDFGILDDIELDEEMQESGRIPPAGMNGDQDSIATPENPFDDGMMSIEAILAGESSTGDEGKLSQGQPSTGLPEEDDTGFGSGGNRDEIEVDGGILTLDDDLKDDPFSNSVEKTTSFDTGNEFSFGFPEDTDPFGQGVPGYSEEEAFGAFSLDELDLDGHGSLDDLELDIPEEEEEEIDSAGLLPDDILSEINRPGDNFDVKKTAVPKADVLNFGGFGDSATDELMTFGGGDDDGLLSMLKTDIKSKKSVQDVSLVRTMKDTDVGVQELIVGLEDVLKKMGGKPSSPAKNQEMEK